MPAISRVLTGLKWCRLTRDLKSYRSTALSVLSESHIQRLPSAEEVVNKPGSTGYHSTVVIPFTWNAVSVDRAQGFVC